MFHPGIADDDRLTKNRRMFNSKKAKVDADDVPGLAEQGGDLIEQPGTNAHEFVLGSLAKAGEVPPLIAPKGGQFSFVVTPGRRAEACRCEAERVKAAEA